jgi:phosphoglycolate phosphatase-like HAD superfamily hydrolase
MKEIYLFDCDGVILNSNLIKKDAFYLIAKECNHPSPSNFVKWCSENNGISRHVKLKRLCDELLNSSNSVEKLIDRYSELVTSKLILSDITPYLNEMKQMDAIEAIGWGIISGGSKGEISAALNNKGVDHLFNLGIYGNPKNKYEIFEQYFSKYIADASIIYFGDSKYDYEFASSVGIDFVFVEDWSESKDYFQKIGYKNKVNKLHNFWGIN